MVQKNIILLVGETGAGKTAYIEKLSGNSHFEVINCDSRQIFKYFNIGTAKPSVEFLMKIKHHLIDIVEIDSEFSAGDFQRSANALLEKNTDYVVSAGTPFYLNILLNGIDEIPAVSIKTREKVTRMYIDKGIEFLYEYLEKNDPERAVQLNRNDCQRIKRAVEIHQETGLKMSSFFKGKPKGFTEFSKIIYLYHEKNILKERISARTEQMLKDGLIDEVKDLLNKYGEKIMFEKPIIGYIEVCRYLAGEYNIDMMKNEIIKNSMALIKRQRVFFKKILSPYKFDIV